jgi:hypothetical protein
MSRKKVLAWKSALERNWVPAGGVKVSVVKASWVVGRGNVPQSQDHRGKPS